MELKFCRDKAPLNVCYCELLLRLPIIPDEVRRLLKGFWTHFTHVSMLWSSGEFFQFVSVGLQNGDAIFFQSRLDENSFRYGHGRRRRASFRQMGGLLFCYLMNFEGTKETLDISLFIYLPFYKNVRRRGSVYGLVDIIRNVSVTKVTDSTRVSLEDTHSPHCNYLNNSGVTTFLTTVQPGCIVALLFDLLVIERSQCFGCG